LSYLVLPLMAGFPNLRCLSRMALALRPPQATDLGIGQVV
jgi:hypothetical protein